MEKIKREHQILIVDDNPRNVQILGKILSDQGYNIFIATNGFQALKSLEKKIPDLILLDINMPEMDGFETCIQIKHNENFAEIPIIFLTARNETDDMLKAFAIGGADYITKPFNTPELLARVNQQLALKEKAEDLKQTNENNKELLRVLLHDLRNPIVAIDSINKIFNENPDVYVEMNDILLQATNNCLEILESVRKMYRLQDKKIDLELKDLNLSECVHSSLLIFKNALLGKDIRVEVDIPSEIFVHVDANSFSNSILNNILTNAIKFSYPNSIIKINAKETDLNVILSIKDFGIGIPERILNNIFDVTKTTSRIGTQGEIGTGYGMPLVKKFLEMFGGSIELYSVEQPNKDHGTEAILKLPAAKES
ncbi:MAG TPA: hybrid sensor histidine kinase/response regulator [Leptospiraceae bacterium]|nr:hybrid sensor histidine kinase/response regulator [Leptospiraceae bacterium]HMX31161.1 hybrid sensor histidine kinase/response regulator [Leptospiraceae bacterium]HMY30689.1 hybrid sensor histidine kinase/response regulator [Leptospiraceae bacterium]HMZ63242.1 hybrid sensor histidine kinase/response regulator [Leptospiraceae bacterium]HNA06236.1 hybrid sensor histidine kinase/response regulator [Leptospiraceae bacterium]